MINSNLCCLRYGSKLIALGGEMTGCFVILLDLASNSLYIKSDLTVQLMLRCDLRVQSLNLCYKDGVLNGLIQSVHTLNQSNDPFYAFLGRSWNNQ